MSHTLKKAALTLAAALGSTAASAQASFEVWFGPYMGQHAPHDAYPQAPHQAYPRAPHHAYPQPPRHPGHQRPHYETTPHAKCENAIARQQDLTHQFRHTNVGFIEGHTYACKIKLDTGRLTGSYNLQTQRGVSSYQNAVNNAARYEDGGHRGYGHGHNRERDRYRDLPHW